MLLDYFAALVTGHLCVAALWCYCCPWWLTQYVTVSWLMYTTTSWNSTFFRISEGFTALIRGTGTWVRDLSFFLEVTSFHCCMLLERALNLVSWLLLHGQYLFTGWLLCSLLSYTYTTARILIFLLFDTNVQLFVACNNDCSVQRLLKFDNQSWIKSEREHQHNTNKLP